MSHTESSEVSTVPAGHEAPVGFFAIGLVVNLVLITAYFVWARKQWKKPDKEILHTAHHDQEHPIL